MVENESTSRDDRQKLGELFVSVTGETGTTDRQSTEPGRDVIDVTEDKSSSQRERPDSDPKPKQA